jgi:hypothetical protein
MTCTGRTTKLSANNEYPTPQAFAYQIAKYCADLGWYTSKSRVLEPCAGEGRIVSWLQYCAPGVEVHAVERSERYRRKLARRTKHCWTHDFMTWQAPALYDLIITNPPFSDAEAVARKALLLLRSGGRLVLLQRLGFMAGGERNATFWPDVTYSDLLICTSRPRFLNNASDSADYAWFVFTNTPWTTKPVRGCNVTHLPRPSLTEDAQLWYNQNALPAILRDPELPQRRATTSV